MRLVIGASRVGEVVSMHRWVGVGVLVVLEGVPINVGMVIEKVGNDGRRRDKVLGVWSIGVLVGVMARVLLS